MKKVIFALLVVLGIVFYFFTINKPEKSSLNKVVITQYGQGNVFLYLPLYIAQEEGIFQKNGLDVQITYSGNDDQIAATVAGGYADFGVGDPIFSAIIQERGGSIKTIATLVEKPPFIGYAKDSKIKNVENLSQLNGLRVSSFPAPSTLYTNLTNLKNNNNLNMQIRPITFGAQMAALENGEVDMAMDLDPTVAVAESNGYRAVISLSNFLPKQAITGIIAREDVIQNKPEIAQKVINSLQEAISLFYSDQSVGLRVALKAFPEIDEASLKRAVERSFNNKIYPISMEIQEEIWQQGIHERIQAGDLKKPQPTNIASDNSFAMKAKSNVQ